MAVLKDGMVPDRQNPIRKQMEPENFKLTNEGDWLSDKILATFWCRCKVIADCIMHMKDEYFLYSFSISALLKNLAFWGFYLNVYFLF